MLGLPAYIAILCPRGNECSIKERESKRKREREGESGAGAGKFSKVELGNRCERGGRGPAGKGGGCMLCVCMRVRARVHVIMRARERAFVCVSSCRKGTGHERTLRERLFYSA